MKVYVPSSMSFANVQSDKKSDSSGSSTSCPVRGSMTVCTSWILDSPVNGSCMVTFLILGLLGLTFGRFERRMVI